MTLEMGVVAVASDDFGGNRVDADEDADNLTLSK
jgi:hypothetical protein